ncbi:sugar transferase, partial [Acinetobacter baumannii]
YVDNHNVWVDFKIMFKTVKVMLSREGINAPGHVGPSLFKGNDTQENVDSSVK